MGYYTALVTIYWLMIFSAKIVLCMTVEEDTSNNLPGSCNFENDSCEWTTYKDPVILEVHVPICGWSGKEKRCSGENEFQDAVPWHRTRLISNHSFWKSFVKIPDSMFQLFQKLDDSFVMASARDYSDWREAIHKSDLVSTEIPLSMKHRCLRYKYLMLGSGPALAVAYIKNYFRPYDLANYLNVHGRSDVIKFRSASAILPVGIKFKLVFRGIFYRRSYGLFIDNITITQGFCETCGPHEFRCNRLSDECIPLKKVCDFQSDCVGGEDEERCDWEKIGSSCRENTLQNSSSLQKGNDSYTDDGSWKVLNVYEDWGHYLTNISDKCYLYCPVDCTCNGLSLNCSSDDVPSYATSITLYGLVQDSLEINKKMFPNVRELNILYSKLLVLNVSEYLQVETVSIKYSQIGTVFIHPIQEGIFRYIGIIGSSLGRLRILQFWIEDLDFHVENSSLNDTLSLNDTVTTSDLRVLIGNKLTMSQTRGFPGFIRSKMFKVINYTSCNLTEQPDLYYDAIVFDLSHNLLKSWIFLSYTKVLLIHHNILTSLNYTVDKKQSEPRLQYLDLSHNKIFRIYNEDLTDLPNLLYLMLQNNRLANIEDNAFKRLTKLIYLDLSNNQLQILKRTHFLHLSNLQYLYIQNNHVRVIEGMFDGLMNILYLQVDSYTLCCAQPKAVSKIQCLAPINEISSCHHLIDIQLLSVIIWYIALVAVFGNFFGTFYRVYLGNSKSSFAIYSINLGIADFSMGIYLYIIAGANIKFSGRYGFEDDSWRHSPYCTLAGVLATLSSEASALFVLCITIDRILIIRFPFSVSEQRIRRAKIASGFVWAISLFLSLLPLFGDEYFDGYYSNSGICISLPLSVLRKPGWEYSMAIFVGANFVIFIGILIGQLVIFVDVVRMGKEVNSQPLNQRRREIGLAKTLIAVAITDMFCWIPIGTIGLLTLMGTDVTTRVYAWIIVVVLPINSALNPLIYTFSAILRHKGPKRASSMETKEVIKNNE